MSRKHPTPATPAAQPAPPAAPAEPAEQAAEEKPGLSGLLWKVVGGLAVGLGLAVVVAVYHSVQAQLGGLKADIAAAGKELRGETTRLGTAQNTMAKKEEVSTRLRNVWDRLKELQAGRTDLTSLRERCALLGELYKAGEAERMNLADQVRKMREKGRAAEEKAELAKQVRSLRERIASLETRPAGSAEEAEKP